MALNVYHGNVFVSFRRSCYKGIEMPSWWQCHYNSRGDWWKTLAFRGNGPSGAVQFASALRQRQ